MLTMEACVLTNPGRVRPNNEDSVTLVRAAAEQGDGLLAVVADGMGGHEGGERASGLAVEWMTRVWADHAADPATALREAFAAANRAIFSEAERNPGLRGMGTTCVAVGLRNGSAWWAWVGDSRLYLVRSGSVYRLTVDHTAVHEMVRRGVLTAEEARNHPDRSVLIRAMGTHAEVQPDLPDQPLALRSGDRLLLCTDGLHDLVDDDEIAQYAGAGAVSSCAESLLNRALECGGHDNISLILLEAADPSAPARQAAITREHACL
jgi:PPM family protein phosphatase